MPDAMFTSTAYCNRCDRGFVGTGGTQEAAVRSALAMLERHVVKHDDYVPELHSEIDPE